MTPQPTDYRLSNTQASALKSLVMLPAELRRKVLQNYQGAHGAGAIVDLFVEFIGLANSVVVNVRDAAETLCIIEDVVPSHKAEQLNFPTIFGACLGVANAAKIDGVKTCSGCAFKLGTWANQCESTSIDASESVDGEFQFYCHENLGDDGSPKRLCPGYAAARKSITRANATPDQGEDQ